MTPECVSKTAELGSGIRIHYHECGEGEPLVFLHGAGPGASGLSNFESNYAYFAERGYRTLMPDIVGWGRSSKPAGVPYDYALLAGSLGDWLASLGIGKCPIAGNAMGGSLAVYLAITRPELVDRLVLLAPAAVGKPEAYAAMPGLQALVAVVSNKQEISVEAMTSIFKLMFHDPAMIDARTVAARTELVNTQPREVYANLQLGTQLDRLAEIVCDTLVFWGAGDRFCPVETAGNLLENIPSSRLVTIASCGHWVHVEKADLFNRLTLDFLRNG